jgi:hypothetical protein
MALTLPTMVLVLFALLFLLLGFITLNRYISYKERVALAQLGFSLEDLSRDATKKRYGNRGVLWGGVITAMSGLALLLGLATLGTGAWLLAGLLPLFVGLGMALIYFVTLGPAPSPESRQLDEGHGRHDDPDSAGGKPVEARSPTTDTDAYGNDDQARREEKP